MLKRNLFAVGDLLVKTTVHTKATDKKKIKKQKIRDFALQFQLLPKSNIRV